jgi:hypothetical protein
LRGDNVTTAPKAFGADNLPLCGIANPPQGSTIFLKNSSFFNSKILFLKKTH